MSDSLMTGTLFCTGLLLASALTYAMRAYSLRFEVMDIPGARSSHQIPTPRGGGLAIVIALSMLLLWSGINGDMLWREVWALILPGAAVAAIGFIDDHRPLPSSLRLLVHSGAALLALALVPKLPSIALGTLTLEAAALLFPLTALALVWLLNLYNFMDGIDGIAGGEALSVLAGAGCILYLSGDVTWWPRLLWIAAPIAGFLIWNWQPAKIFLGDVGSAYLGLTLGIVALLTSATSTLTLWSWIILLGVFIVDATWTLLVRMLSGQRWHQPHRSHAYQVLSRKTGSHAKVSFTVVLINLIWLTPLAWLASRNSTLGWAIAALAYLPLLLICRTQGAGQNVTKRTE